ncbi:MAG: GyrI-like domain-containing protein, partial [Oscillospiraceae bacterium]|nr:GyrI-like domain-containing protein [Oscillospiraceae bacterium]
MAFDFKKEYKEFYMPKNKPEIVTVPRANYIAVRGKGNPNEDGGAYQKAISVLYAVAYTLKMSYKTDENCKCKLNTSAKSFNRV